MKVKEPERKEIPLRPFLEKLIDGKIIKDLCENEEICPTCGGFSITLRDNPFYTPLDVPYKMAEHHNQQLTLMNCPDCYNGVVRRCSLCGKLIKRGWLKHDCEQQKALDRAEEERKESEAFANAPIAPPEVESACKMFFSDFFNDGFFEDWDEFFEEWWEEDKDAKYAKRPEFVWITEPNKFRIDAETICERATEDLYEGAYSDITDRDFGRLQKLLDEWCESCGVGTSHRVSNKYKVRIPWEEYEKMKKEMEA